jgi:hypothetical protein
MGLGMTILRPVSRSPEKGAETLVWLATSPDVANVSGAYFFDRGVVAYHRHDLSQHRAHLFQRAVKPVGGRP